MFDVSARDGLWMLFAMGVNCNANTNASTRDQRITSLSQSCMFLRVYQLSTVQWTGMRMIWSPSIHGMSRTPPIEI